MRIEEIEIYSDASNAAIMRHPGRTFPGVLIQGDSLGSYIALLRDAIKNLESGDKEEGLEVVKEVREILEGYLTHYAETLKSQGVELPFKWPQTT